MREDSLNPPAFTVVQKLLHIHWIFVFLLCVLAVIGVAMLYSAANGSFQPWASRHGVRFAVGLGVMLGLSLIDIRHWFRFAYAIYGFVLALLVMVELMGFIGMGAQRWIDLGYFNLQPSELMKMALVLALARYFHSLTVEDVGRLTCLIFPLLLIIIPVRKNSHRPNCPGVSDEVVSQAPSDLLSEFSWHELTRLV